MLRAVRAESRVGKAAAVRETRTQIEGDRAGVRFVHGKFKLPDARIDGVVVRRLEELVGGGRSLGQRRDIEGAYVGAVTQGGRSIDVSADQVDGVWPLYAENFPPLTTRSASTAGSLASCWSSESINAFE
jgi:hypothetical protein